MENYKELFLKYLKDECNKEELNVLLNWLKNPLNSDLIETYIKEDWGNFNPLQIKTSSEIDKSFEFLKERIMEGQLPEIPKLKDPNGQVLITSHQYKRKRVIYRLAASIVLPLIIGSFIYYFISSRKTDNQLSRNEITVPLGSKTIVLLGDGTKVWLNSGSKLTYPQVFSGNTREVQLIGEGFFEVSKNAGKPFIVKTSELYIKVLGTSFNVKSYPEEGTIETTLVHGLVTISKSCEGVKDNAIYLKPNQRVTYIKQEGKLILTDVEKKHLKEEVKSDGHKKREEKIILSENIDTDQFTAWKDDKLVFKNDNFESLCIKLERWYGVKINILNPELKNFHYTGTVRNETINDVFKIIKLTMPLEYSINHDVIDIWSAKSTKYQKTN